MALCGRIVKPSNAGTRLGEAASSSLDWIPESGSPTYEERREFLVGLVETERLSTGEWQSFPENALLLPPSVRDEENAVPDFYAGLKAINRRLRCDFFEGVVMSRPKGDSQPRAARRVRESAATAEMRRIRCSCEAIRRSAGRGPSTGL